MLTSVAVLADIHGVLPALDAVLAEPAVRDAERIVLAGDHVSGPQPVEVLDRLMELGERAVWVRGNADREVVELAGADGDSPPAAGADPISAWCAARLRPDQIQFLDAMAPREILDVNGFGRVVCCHATPRDDEEVVLVDSRLDRWVEVFDGLDDTISTVVCGHTHMPFVRLVDRRLVINPGSVGMPYGAVGAHWAVLHEGAVSLRRTLYDVEAACVAVAEQSAYPDAPEWVDYYLHARASDVEALLTFGPRDGRPAS